MGELDGGKVGNWTANQCLGQISIAFLKFIFKQYAVYSYFKKTYYITFEGQDWEDLGWGKGS